MDKTKVRKIMDSIGYKESTFEEFINDAKKYEDENNSFGFKYTQSSANKHNLTKFIPSYLGEENNKKYFIVELSSEIHVRAWVFKNVKKEEYMNLYKVICFHVDGTQWIELFVANSDKQAETFAFEKHGDDFYCYDAKIVDNVDGYKISALK